MDKCCIFYCIRHDQGKIPGCCMMDTAFIFSIQTIGCNKMCVLTSQLFCFFIHLLCKTFYGSADMFRDGHSGIIMAFQHQGIEKILQIKLLAFPHAKTCLWLRCRIPGNLYVIISLCQLQSKNTGHYLCGAGIRPSFVCFFSVQHTAGLPIHENCRKCI